MSSSVFPRADVSGAESNPAPILSVRELQTVIRTSRGPVEVLRGVSFDLHHGETLGLVGESGCGKTMTVLSITGLYPQPVARIAGGEVWFEGVDLLQLSERRWREVRGAGFGIVYQDPMTSLNPLMRIEDQIAEVITSHGGRREDAARRVIEVLDEVGIPEPKRAARAYPHEFSGGMRQRVVIAMALALHPKVLIADEPTTALDVTTQQQIIALVQRLQRAHRMAVIWITHDLGIIARMADRVCIMYAGHIVEEGPTTRIFEQAEHPYTDGLIASIPHRTGSERGPLRVIPGSLPDPARLPSGCAFVPRCPQAVPKCSQLMPPLTARGGSEARCWVPPAEWTRS